MTRKKQIEEAASLYPKEYELKHMNADTPRMSGEHYLSFGFRKGAEWADLNPLKYGGFTDDQFAIAPLHIHDECQSRYEVLKAKLEEAYKDFGKLQAENYKQAIKLGIAIEALKEKARLEPGPRMYENCAAGIALVEIEKLDRK